ncbi:acyltransferase family protein [Devosia salina]|uniref:Acyltransferase n=1 Tax=Devosia salina TaxID=2860336 RepID=A0ABX8WFW1_9HYPH|nr:acyltransferase [Devosia salina]QYO77785.1 acyltransferase [Devosia salina]
MKPAEHGTAGYRRDIDGLRAIAVLAVIAFHASPGLLGSGYLGVDIFFVISGYVITGYLVRAPKRGLTSYVLDFYSRRIRRLLPALLLCILVTAWAFVLVTTRPPKDVFDTGAWALLGLSNIQLFLASQDYFALEAGLNPFTHTWSLGVEEQYYLIYPALFAILGWTWHSGDPRRGISH